MGFPFKIFSIAPPSPQPPEEGTQGYYCCRIVRHSHFRVCKGDTERSGGDHAFPAPGKAMRCVAELDSAQARQGRLGETSFKSWKVSPLVNKDSHVGHECGPDTVQASGLWSLGAVVGWRLNWVPSLGCASFRVRRTKLPGEVGWPLLFTLISHRKAYSNWSIACPTLPPPAFRCGPSLHHNWPGLRGWDPEQVPSRIILLGFPCLLFAPCLCARGRGAYPTPRKSSNFISITLGVFFFFSSGGLGRIP